MADDDSKLQARPLHAALPPNPLQQVALKLLGSFFSSSEFGEELAAPLGEIAALLRELGACAFFDDWSRVRGAPEEVVPPSVLSVSALNCNPGHEAAFAIDGSLDKSWVSGTFPAQLVVELTEPQTLTAVEVATDPEQRCAPYVVEVEMGGGWETLVVDCTQASVRLAVDDSEPVSKIKFSVAAEAAGCKLASVLQLRALRPLRTSPTAAAGELAPYTPTRELLASAERWLAGAAAVPALAAPALSGLSGLTLASGSLTCALRLAHVLWSAEGELEAAVAADARAFLSRFTQDALAAKRKCMIAERSGDGALSNLSPVFDAAHADLEPGLSMEDDGRRVSSSTSSKKHITIDVGFTSGRASWEFRLDRDTHGDECVAFGAAIKPVTNSDYSKSPQLWMYRAYNGQLYERGVATGRSYTKIHQGNIVRCELDVDAGTLAYYVDGALQGVAFSSLAGVGAIYPCVCFYGANRAVSIVSLEADGAVPTEDAFLADLKEKDSSVGYGVLGKNGELGYDGATASVGGSPTPHALSLHPPRDGISRVSYSLSSDYGRLTGAVALDDSAAPETAVTFEVLGDGSLLWASPPLSEPGQQLDFDVAVSGVDNLELFVVCPGPSTGAHALFLQPLVTPQPNEPWTCSRCLSMNISTVPTCDVCGLARGDVKEVVLPEPSASSHADVVQGLLSTLQGLTNVYMRAMRESAPEGKAIELDMPFAVEVSADSFRLLTSMLERVLPACEGAADRYDTMTDVAVSLINLLKINVRRLLISRVRPADAGLTLEGDSTDALYSLQPVKAQLKAVMAGDYNAQLHAAAFAALDVWAGLAPPVDDAALAALAPGATVELQFTWPLMTSDGEPDARFERALTLLQVRARAMRLPLATFSRWSQAAHLVIGLPEGHSTVDFLELVVAESMRQAGLLEFALPGCSASPAVALKVENFLRWNRRERRLFEPGVGWIRVYPRTAGSFDDVVEQLRAHFSPLDAAKKEGEGA